MEMLSIAVCDDEIVECCHLALGGIPHYLNQFSPKLSVAENIRRNILTKGSPLYSEVEFLLHSLRMVSILAPWRS